jgi:hypothetical protein
MEGRGARVRVSGDGERERREKVEPDEGEEVLVGRRE